MLPQGRAPSAYSAAPPAPGKRLPSPEALFRGATSNLNGQQNYAAVYRAIEVGAVPGHNFRSREAPAGAHGRIGASLELKEMQHVIAQNEGFPPLPWPLETYPYGQAATFRCEAPDAVLMHVEASLKSAGCHVQKLGTNTLSAKVHSVEPDLCVSCHFAVSVWDVSRDPLAEDPTFVDVQHLDGCPFLFYDTVDSMLGKEPRGKRFRCLSVPSQMGTSPIQPSCLEAVLQRCVEGEPRERAQALCSLANLCSQDAAVRQSVQSVKALDRLAGACAETVDAVVKQQYDRLAGILA